MVRNTALALISRGWLVASPQVSRDCRGIMSAVGTKQTCLGKLRMSALRREADMPQPSAPYQSDANDPNRT
jgi:hypothetical protein